MRGEKEKKKEKAKVSSAVDVQALDLLLDQPAWRRKMARTLHGFELVYLPHHFDQPPALYHDQLNATLENPQKRFLNIMGHRGSGKTTKAALSFVLWAALENPDKYPFIIIGADTVLQAKTHLANIKDELENNQLLQTDYELDLKTVEWQKLDFTLPNGVRILARSRGQKVRGLKHKQYRVGLFIGDDLEDADWARKKENRDKTERWLRREVLPALREHVGRMIIIGNMVHRDCLVARLEADPLFETLKFPLLDEKDKCLWPAKYPTKESIDELKKLVGNITWQREYLLKPVAEEGQEVKEEWIQYYDSLPVDFEAQGIGVDLAISKSETADFTAMVPAQVVTENGQKKIYILTNIVNERLNFKETIEAAKGLAKHLDSNPLFFVEKVAYQQAAIEELEREHLAVVPVKPGTDKRARLRTVARYIQDGTVVFPKRGAEDLIDQLVGFGVEAHDDLVDAFVYAVTGLIEYLQSPPEVLII